MAKPDRHWLRGWFRRDESLAALEKRLAGIERKLEALQLERNPQKLPQPGSPGPVPACKDEPPAQIFIERVEKVIVEKLEYSNNFGALGIRELTGKLNIGTNYTGPLPPELFEEVLQSFKPGGEGKESDPKKHPPEPAGPDSPEERKGPRLNMRAGT